MLNFSNEAPVDPRGNSLPLKRTPTGRPVKGIITCHDLIGTPTHFFHGRTVPCDTEICPACDEGVPWRWHGYVSLYLPNAHHHVLFEFTAKPSEVLKQYRLAYGSLRGCVLSARRANLSPNARVIMTTGRADLEDVQLPPAPNIREALAIIWNIELSAIEVSGLQKGHPAARVTHNPALDRCDPPSPAADVAGGNGRDQVATN